MKRVKTLVIYFLYFLPFYLCAFPLVGVLLEPIDSNESNVNLQNSENHTSFTAINDSVYNTDEILSDDNTQIDSEDIKEFSNFPEISDSFENKEFINNDTPIAVSHVDSASKDLQDVPPSPAEDISPVHSEIKESNVIKQTMAQVEKATDSNNSNGSLSEIENEAYVQKNLTEKNEEAIPSFSEWAQKHLEAEKKEQTNVSIPTHIVNSTKSGSGAKLRWKNYASVDCGAKVILANSEGKNSWAILSPSRDEYKLDPCNSRIWFIVELCEPIQLKKIDMANYELFSSSPKDFTVSVSSRFPTRDWLVVGNFVAKDEKDIQSFDISTDTFGKYVKVEIKSHYRSEYYCPISLFSAYGTSVFEVLQKDDPGHEHPVEDDDDDEVLDNALKGDGLSSNLFSSATDAVLTMVKKAAQLLGNKVMNDSSQLTNDTLSNMSVIKSCNSPSHYIVCNNCSNFLFSKIFELLSCKQREISNLVNISFIAESLKHSNICKEYGFDLNNNSSKSTLKTCPELIQSFFPSHYIGAMCNSLAITYNKVLYNISYQYANTTEDITHEHSLEIKQDVVPQVTDGSNNNEAYRKNDKPAESFTAEQQSINSKSSCSTDTTYLPQMPPLKSVTLEHPLLPQNNTLVTIEESSEDVSLEQQDEIVTVESTSDMPEAEVTSESSGEDNIEKIMTELSNEPTQSPLTTATTIQGQKESVFLRLSNRIKALERNMSLSAQYLEELSKRYKKQVEEMQWVLEKNEQSLKKVMKKNEERYAAHKPATIGTTKHAEIQRRNSVDVVNSTCQKKKKRRPSDQALKIVATSASGDQEKSKKRRKKTSFQSDSIETGDKFFPRCTSSKIGLTKSPSADWVECKRVIEDIPFALDESDHSYLERMCELPQYINTAINMRLNRATFRKKSKSVEETRTRQPSPISTNGSVSSYNEQTPKKEKKGFRKLLKKVF
ncbi:hypothetical protein GWI33_016960 [Rhynchophorus ferrugineus]|uniref:SUN domain-containing protein n=1 Tax=Rhynchophorus ferrugineus TaxID=354439 RepID=A0A834I2T0_RHYFE|nr:hypothetical protein GWI33_016960 [Rhynchophorus ferrugineus]